MITVANVLDELGVKDWILRGNPINEKEFKQMFRKVTGLNKNNSAIESDDSSKFGVTWNEISVKKKELELQDQANQYQYDRLLEYPSLQECIHAILDDDLDALQAKRSAIKAKYPKPK